MRVGRRARSDRRFKTDRGAGSGRKVKPDKDAKPGQKAGFEKGTKKESKAVPEKSTKQVVSITKQIRRYLRRNKLLLSFGFCLLLLAVMVGAFVFGCEVGRLGNLDLKGCSRSISFPGGRDIFYRVTSKATGTVVFGMERSDAFFKMLMLDLVIFAVLVIRELIAGARSAGEVARMLDPLNELALKADELSRLSFSEDKYQILEDAIGKINPEEAQDQALSFGDSDLAGVEAAMNNLLIRMRDTYRQQARFVNDASHELRTPIAVIQGYANMLDRWGKSDERILEESIAAIKNESDHMNHLVEQLLFLARGDSGRTVLKPVRTDLRAMMQEVYEESFMIDEAHPYRFRPFPNADGGEEIPIQADPGLLKQAVRILIDNAAKYTRAGDEILLGCGVTEKGEPYLQVQDFGIGMAEADVQHMFERFYRSDEVRSYQGTGLGLSIAKWIVDKHHGHFEILSRTGLGTRIRIVF